MARSQITAELMFRARAEGRDRAETAFAPGLRCPVLGPLGLWNELPPADRDELEGTALAAARCRWGELEAEALRASQAITLAAKVRTPTGVSAVVVREDRWDVPDDRLEARTLLGQVLEAQARMLEAGLPLARPEGRDPAAYVAELERLRAEAQ